MKVNARSNGQFSSPLSYYFRCLYLFFRLKTRICHVQISEEQLEEKRVHCEYSLGQMFVFAMLKLITDEKVVTAFQSALELLNDP